MENLLLHYCSFCPFEEDSYSCLFMPQKKMWDNHNQLDITKMPLSCNHGSTKEIVPEFPSINSWLLNFDLSFLESNSPDIEESKRAGGNLNITQELSSWFRQLVKTQTLMMLKSERTRTELNKYTYSARGNSAIDRNVSEKMDGVSLPFLLTISYSSPLIHVPTKTAPRQLNTEEECNLSYTRPTSIFETTLRASALYWKIHSSKILPSFVKFLRTLSDPTDYGVGCCATESDYVRQRSLSETVCSSPITTRQRSMLSDSTSSENSDDCIVFLRDGSISFDSRRDDASETSESSSDLSSDENGWTSDCDTLCDALSDPSCRAFGTTLAASKSLPEESFDGGYIQRLSQGIDLSFHSSLHSDSSDDNDDARVNPAIEEDDSGINSNSSNPSDSSTASNDETDPNHAFIISLFAATKKFSSKISPCVHSPTKSFFASADVTLDLNHESDWESDTESEDVNTHHPSRSSRSRAAAAQAASVVSPTGWTLTSDRCSCGDSASILKCSHCVITRRMSSNTSNPKSVWFPCDSEMTTTRYLEDSGDESEEAGGHSGARSCSSSSRKSPWEMVARDRVRFRRRISQCEAKISHVLTPSHRNYILNSSIHRNSIPLS